MLHSIGRGAWLAISVSGWVAAMSVHGAAWAGIDLPDAVPWVLFVGIFPPFFVAGFTHPRAVVRGARAWIGPIAAARGASPIWIALGYGTLAYTFAVGALAQVPNHVQLGTHHLAPAENVMLTALTATFFGFSAMLQSSAMAEDRALAARLAGP